MTCRRLLLLLLALVVGSSCRTREPPPPRPRGRIIVPSAPPGSVPPQLTARSLRDALAVRYRLPPDRRILDAVADVHVLITGTDRTGTQVEWSPQGDGCWLVRYRSTEVGRLPEFPDFLDGRDLLTTWATHLLQPSGHVARGKGPQKHQHHRHPTHRAPQTEAHVAAASDDQPAPDLLGPAEDLIALWSRVQDGWGQGPPQPALAQQGAWALAGLSFQLQDEAEIADELPRRALALAALSRALGRTDTARQEVLLARALGYGGAAATLAAALPQDDLVRAYAQADLDRLSRQAMAEGPDRRTARMLYLRLLLDQGLPLKQDELPDLALKDDPGSLPLWALRGRMGTDKRGPMDNAGLALGLLAAVAQQIGAPQYCSPQSSDHPLRSATPLRAQTVLARIGCMDFDGSGCGTARGGVWLRSAAGHQFAGRCTQQALAPLTGEPVKGPQVPVLKTLEDALSRLGGDGPGAGPLGGPAVQRAYYRGYLYTGLMRLREAYYALGSPEGTKQFVAAVGPGSTDVGHDFARWLELLAGAERGSVNPAHLADTIAHLAGTPASLGAAPLLALFLELRTRSAVCDGLATQALERFAERLDSRLEHRVVFGGRLLDDLLDITGFERLTGSALLAAPTDRLYLQVDLAHRRLDVGRLRELLRGPLHPGWRLEALRGLRDAGALDQAGLVREVDRLMSDEPDDFSLYEVWSEALDQQKDYAGSRRVIERWLAKHESDSGLLPIAAWAQVARTHRLEGHPDLAWDAVKGVIVSQKADVMYEGSKALAEQGERLKAVALAELALSRYTKAASVVNKAQVLWQVGFEGQAAALLHEPPAGVSERTYKDGLAVAFMRVFGRRPPAEAEKAVRALIGEGMYRGQMDVLLDGLEEQGAGGEMRFPLAQALLEHAEPGSLQRWWRLLAGYRALRDWKGQKEALQWLQTTAEAVLPPGGLLDLKVDAFGKKLDELLWDLRTDSREDRMDDKWLLKAAAQVRAGDPAGPRRELLLQHFRGPAGDPRTDYYHQLGRYLMGLTDEDTVLGLAVGPHMTCEIAYYVGLKAQAQGRQVDAARWYQVSVQTGSHRDGEFIWSRQQLEQWLQKRRSLTSPPGAEHGTAQESGPPRPGRHHHRSKAAQRQ